MRAVVDTNVWISALLNAAGRPAEVLKAYEDGRFTLVMSLPGLDEIRAVLSRPRFSQRYGVKADDVDEYASLLREHAHLVPLSGGLDVCRDPKDNHLIELAIEGRANVVVSRDEDLTRDLEVVRYLDERGVRTLTVQRFLDELKGS